MLTRGLVFVTLLDNVMYIVCSLASPCLMEHRGLRVTQIAYFSPSIHTKQHLLATFCDTTAGMCEMT